MFGVESTGWGLELRVQGCEVCSSGFRILELSLGCTVFGIRRWPVWIPASVVASFADRAVTMIT